MKIKLIATALTLTVVGVGFVYATQDNKHLAYTDPHASKCFRTAKRAMTTNGFVLVKSAYVGDGSAEVSYSFTNGFGARMKGAVSCAFDGTKNPYGSPNVWHVTVNGYRMQDWEVGVFNLTADL